MDVLKDKFVKTRKPHRCFGCLREMRPGSTMKYFAAVDAGEFLSVYFCAVCDEYMSIRFNDGFAGWYDFGWYDIEDSDLARCKWSDFPANPFDEK